MTFASRSAEIALFGAGRLFEMLKAGSLTLTAEDVDILKDIIAQALEEARAAGQTVVVGKLGAMALKLKEMGIF